MLCLGRWLTGPLEANLLQLAAVALDLERIYGIRNVILLLGLSRSPLPRFVNRWIACLWGMISHPVIVTLLTLRLDKADIILAIDVTWIDEPICFNRVDLIFNWIKTLASPTWRLKFLAVSHLTSNLLVRCLYAAIRRQRKADLRYFMHSSCVALSLLFTDWLHCKVVLVWCRADIALPEFVALSELIIPTFRIALVWPFWWVICFFGLLLTQLAIKALS